MASCIHQALPSAIRKQYLQIHLGCWQLWWRSSSRIDQPRCILLLVDSWWIYISLFAWCSPNPSSAFLSQWEPPKLWMVYRYKPLILDENLLFLGHWTSLRSTLIIFLKSTDITGLIYHVVISTSGSSPGGCVINAFPAQGVGLRLRGDLPSWSADAAGELAEMQQLSNRD